MPRGGDVVADSVTHLLICADTKMGKSDYVAQAILDGFTVIYIDADNGLKTLKKILGSNEAALSRLIYLRTEGIYDFFRLFCEKNVIRWNSTKDEEFVSSTAKPDDLIIEIRPSLIPKTVIFALDSWTSIQIGAMRASASDKSVKLINMGNTAQQVYGQANLRLDTLLDIFQKVPFHTITQAHSLIYEVMEKPIGKIADNSKQSDMTIKESIRVPKSCSKPHGQSMGKYFNEIGWLVIDQFGKMFLDFTKQYDRVGGGSLNSKGDPREQYRFSKIFAKPVPISDAEIHRFWREYPAGSYKEPVLIPSAAPTQTESIPATPSGPVPSGGVKTGSSLMSRLKK